MDEAATTMHPCWEAYRLADKYVKLQCDQCFICLGFNSQLVCLCCRRGLVIYVNAFSGDATVEFPSMLQMARGGVC